MDNIRDIVELFEGLAEKDIKKSGNYQAMERLLALLVEKLDKDSAVFIVSHTAFSVSDNFPLNYPEEFERCLVAFAKLSVNAKEAIEVLLGEHWKAAVTANPLTFSLQL